MISARKRARGRLEDGAANPVDAYVGNRIRLRRLMLNLSQKKLALMLGITFQQVQKYELGINRIGASRLWDMAAVLQVPVNFFFEGMNADVEKLSPRNLLQNDEDGCIQIENNYAEPACFWSNEGLELVIAWQNIKNKKLRAVVQNLLRSLAEKK